VPDPGPLRLQSRVCVVVVVLVVVVVVAGAAVAAGAFAATGVAAGAGIAAGAVLAGDVCVERWRWASRCDFGRALLVGDGLVSRRVSTRRRTSTGACFAGTAPRRRAWGCGARGRRVCGRDRAAGAGAPARG
jgi:hypothetical protein